MKWDAAMEALLAQVKATAAVTDVIPAADVVMAGDRDFKVPSLEWSLIDDREEENEAPMRTQWDIHVRSMDDVIAVEGALRGIMHHDLPVEIQGVPMWTTYEGGQWLESPKDGQYSRSLDFTHKPVRE